MRGCGAGAGAGEVEDRGDPVVHPLGAVQDVAEQLPGGLRQRGCVPLVDELDEPGRGPQRLAQVMAQRGGEGLEVPVGPLELLGPGRHLGVCVDELLLVPEPLGDVAADEDAPVADLGHRYLDGPGELGGVGGDHRAVGHAGLDHGAVGVEETVTGERARLPGIPVRRCPARCDPSAGTRPR